MSGKPRTNFSQDNHCTAVIGTDSIVKLRKITKMMALLRHFSEFHDDVNRPPTHQVYTVALVEELVCLSLGFCKDKWYHKLNAQINIQNMILPHVR